MTASPGQRRSGLPAFASLVLLTLAGCATQTTGSPAASDLPASVRSPDGHIEWTLRPGRPTTYSVTVDGQVVLADSRLGLRFRDGTEVGTDSRLVRVERHRTDTTWENRFGKRRVVRDHHHELRAFLVEAPGMPFEVAVRVFDDGLGFRYELPARAGVTNQDFVLEEERTQFVFTGDHPCHAGTNENTGTPRNPLGYFGSQESEYLPQRLADLPTTPVRLLPLLVHTPAAWVALTESDLVDWAGLWVNRAADGADRTTVTLQARPAPRRDGQGLVKSAFPRHSPWRTLLLAREPARLVESDLVLNLATPCALADTSWIKPGIAAWDWWSEMTQPSTATYREYIRFAGEMGWPYALLDGGWSRGTNILHGSTEVDMDDLLPFARENHVRLWVWAHWNSVDRDEMYRRAFPHYERWGLAGVKIDFMDRDDQEMVDWYEKIVRAAAEHHLMINFHGAFKPTGMIRTWPNQITREGILGNEYNRWSARVTPEHKTTLPFTRLVAGPGDFTPGGFRNRSLDRFKTGAKPTEVQGTRCAELALFVCLESPVVHAADHPSHYRGQPGLEFLRLVPTVWDDTRCLDGAVGEHVVIARRHGDRWFLGALTDRNARDLQVKLDFLGRGTWRLRLWKDAPDSGIEAEHLVTEERLVTARELLDLHLAPAGGAVACLERAGGKPADATR